MKQTEIVQTIVYFREDRDSEIAPTEERLEHQMRTTGQLNGSGKNTLLSMPKLTLFRTPKMCPYEVKVLRW